MMNLGNLRKAIGSTTRRKRVGRGTGSGHGGTSTAGHKGQRARSGQARPYVGFEGGQMRLTRRMPKRGFWSPHRVEYSVVNLEALDKFEAGVVINPQMLQDNGMIKDQKFPVKILARGEVSKALTIQAHRFSDSAKTKIEKAGGKVEVI